MPKTTKTSRKALDPLSKLGELIMLRLRDRAIDYADGLTRGHWKAPALESVQATLELRDRRQRAAVTRCVTESIDAAIHDFLFALQERADFEADIQVLVDGKDVVGLSDGIHAEPCGPGGWRARFSAHPPKVPRSAGRGRARPK